VLHNLSGSMPAGCRARRSRKRGHLSGRFPVTGS
jgi:hypothetical protein